jgi:hypothetical protein
MHLALHTIVVTAAMPFFNVRLNPNSEADAKTEESRDADHDYTVDRRKRIGTLVKSEFGSLRYTAAFMSIAPAKLDGAGIGNPSSRIPST